MPSGNPIELILGAIAARGAPIIDAAVARGVREVDGFVDDVAGDIDPFRQDTDKLAESDQVGVQDSPLSFKDGINQNEAVLIGAGVMVAVLSVVVVASVLRR